MPTKKIVRKPTIGELTKDELLVELNNALSSLQMYTRLEQRSNAMFYLDKAAIIVNHLFSRNED